MKKETSKLLFILAGLLLPVILTFPVPLIKILLADQYRSTGYVEFCIFYGISEEKISSQSFPIYLWQSVILY